MKEQLLNAEGFRANLGVRTPEDFEVIKGEEGTRYANRKDNRTLSYSMVAYDIAERFPEAQEILEVCAGSGHLAYFLHKYTGRRIHATEGGKELIQAARTKYNSENILFEVQNVHNHAGKGKYDLVVCKDSFHHFPDSRQGLKDLSSLLKEGGSLYVFDLTRDCPEEQALARLNTIQNSHEQKRFLQSLNASWTMDEMIALAEECGLNLECQPRLKFSNENSGYHRDMIEKDRTREAELNLLSRIYVFKKNANK